MNEQPGGVSPYPYQQLDGDISVDINDTIGVDQPTRLQIRSLRKTRRIMVLSSLAFLIGALLIVFNSPWRNQLIAPGPLASHHAQILAGQGEKRCAACHGAANRPFLDWVRAAVQGDQGCLPAQSELCLECHQRTMPSATALNPHGIEPARLAQLTKDRASKFKLAGHVGDSESSPSVQLACATCHSEHHGAKFDLAAITDSQCQSCHLQRYRTFESDHPDFHIDLAARHSTIAFDHAVHFKKHFVEKGRPFECQSCHVPDAARNVMQLASFETSCAECHAASIQQAGQKGLVLFSLPTLDVQAISAAGLNVGEWPEAATGDFDGRISPLLWILLNGQLDKPRCLERIKPGFDFADLNSDDEADLKIAAEMATAIKRTLLRLADAGAEQLPIADGSNSGMQNDTTEFQRIADELSPQFFRDALERWFPGTGKKLSHGGGVGGQGLRWLDGYSAFARWQDGQELLADNPLIATTPTYPRNDAAQAVPMAQQERSTNKATDAPPAGRDTSNQGFTVGSPIVDVHNRRNAAEDSTLPALRPETQSADNGFNPQSTDSELLANNPLAVNASNEAWPQVSPKLDSDSESSSDSIGNLELQRNQNALLNPIANQSTAPAIEPDSPNQTALQFDPLAPASQPKRGWLRDDVAFRISFFASGHADPFVTTLQRLANSSRTKGNAEIALVFERACSASESALNCRSCHNPPSPAQGVQSLEWANAYRDPAEKKFTFFNHAPHLLQLDCGTCHRFDWEDKGPMRFAGWADLNSEKLPQLLVGTDFVPISKADCATCHRRDQASNSCTTCHNYHVR